MYVSPLTDPNHGRIESGDIRIVQNNKLRNLLRKGPKYREPVSINLSNCKTEIKNSLTKFSSDWCNKKGVPVKCFTHWISIVMEKVNNKIKKLKSKIKFSKIKQVGTMYKQNQQKKKCETNKNIRFFYTIYKDIS